MIFAYVGMPGSGKSYNVVANQILPALRDGRKVVTNIPLFVDKVSKVTGGKGEIVDFPVQAVMEAPDRIKEFVTPGCVFVLDEVWRLFPSGEKVNKVPEAFKSLLAEHRHMVDAKGNSTQIVLVVQDLANIGAFARRLVEQTFIHTKLTHVGMSSRFRVDVFHGAIGGVIGPQQNRLREMFGQYKPEIWDLYKSHTMSESKSEGANEKAVDTRGNVFKRPAFIFGIPLVVAAAVWGIHSLHKIALAKGIGSDHPASATGQLLSKAPQAAARSVIGASNARDGGGASVVWKVIGWIESEADPSHSVAMLASGNGVKIAVPMSACRFVDNELQCLMEGAYWAQSGRMFSSAIAKPLGSSGN